MPGGVSSPVRAFKSVGGQPIFFDHVKGAYCFDVDGNQYIDYVGTWGPAIIGHADDAVLDALKAQLDKGTSFGAPSPLENVLAKMVIEAVPSVEMVRFTNSGTEACMGMLRVIRAYTDREKIIKFEGCYHGHADSFLVQAGSGVATLGLPDSPGVPSGATKGTLCAKYNDLASVEAIFEANPGEIAGVVLEPVVGNSGFIAPDKAFLQGLRDLTTKHGAVLVFDEVMTGFRIAYGGAQEYFGITPDVTTMGKVIGGGLPVGAYGGKREIMELVAPAGPMYQAGTLSGNPLAMTAGIKTLETLKKPGARARSRGGARRGAVGRGPGAPPRAESHRAPRHTAAPTSAGRGSATRARRPRMPTRVPQRATAAVEFARGRHSLGAKLSAGTRAPRGLTPRTPPAPLAPRAQGRTRSSTSSRRSS